MQEDITSLDLNVRCKPNGAIIFDEKEGKQKELGYVPFMPYYWKWKSNYHSNDGDGFDGTSCSLTIDNIDEETVTIDQPESAPNGVAEAHELLMLESAAHVQMSRAQRALYQALVTAAVHDAMAGKDHSVHLYTFVVDYG